MTVCISCYINQSDRCTHIEPLEKPVPVCKHGEPLDVFCRECDLLEKYGQFSWEER